MVERMAPEQLQIFLEEISFLDPFLSGFHLGYETEIALVALTDNLW